ncbi:MAG: hypothetical protein ACHQ9S_19005 [Candidatus Binatia bacterium]
MCYSTSNPTAVVQQPNHKPTEPEPEFKRPLEKVERFIITSAQNSTPLNRKFFASLLCAKRYLKAELLVVPFRYKNPTSVFSERQKKADELFPKEVRPYLWNQRLRLNANLTLLADIRTQPTAVEPLSGFDAMTGAESAILGHTKLQLRTVATPSNKFPKILTTTGACTVPNYTDSRAGKLGEFHHTLGAVLVEIQGKIFHLRHLNANKTTGEFTDLLTTYHPSGHRKAARPLALVFGDTHVDFIDGAVERATFGAGGMVDTLNPRALVFHDLLDAYSCNPHHKDNPFIAVAKHASFLNDIQKEIGRAIRFVWDRTKGERESVIVGSNHDEFVARYMKSQDWRQDPANAKFYLRTASYLVENLRISDHGFSMPNPFAVWFKWLTGPNDNGNLRILGADESYTKAGIELGMHGDRGPNGAKGSARNLRCIGVKSIIGHSHTPAIEEGCYQVGTSTSLRLEYNAGPSGWLNTHCVLHADGKRQLINIIDGNWRLNG